MPIPSRLPTESVTDSPWTQNHDAAGYDLSDLGTLNFDDATTLTIASGVITITQSYHSIDTEGAAASDDLDTINGGTAGDLLYLKAADGTHTVVLKHGTGNIVTPDGNDYSLDDANKAVALLCDSAGTWHLVGSAGGGPGSDTTAVHDNVAGEIAAITEKTAPASADLLLIEDSAASNAKKKVQIGNLPSSGGDVTGPPDSTDNAIARFDGTTGKILQNTPHVTISDAGVITSDVATGTAPLSIASITVVANLNADKVDGKDETAFLLADGARALAGNLDANGHSLNNLLSLSQNTATGYKGILKGGIYDVVDYGATGDGTTDDTAAIQAAIDAAATAGGGIVYIPPSSTPYMVTSSLNIAGDNITIEGGGWGSVIKAANSFDNSSGGQVFYTNGYDNLVFREFKIDGNRANLSDLTAIGINVHQSTNVLIDHVAVVDSSYDGFYIGYSTTPSENVIIRNCYIDNATRLGIGITSGENIYILFTIIVNTNGSNPQKGIDIEPNGSDNPCNNIFIIDSKFDNNYYGHIGLQGGDSKNRVVITDNLFGSIGAAGSYNWQGAAISARQLGYGVISNNSFSVAPPSERAHILLGGAASGELNVYCNISGNIFYRGDYGVSVLSAMSRSTIANNVFSYTHNPVYVNPANLSETAYELTITGNTMYSPDIGIYLDGSTSETTIAGGAIHVASGGTGVETAADTVVITGLSINGGDYGVKIDGGDYQLLSSLVINGATTAISGSVGSNGKQDNASIVGV